MTAPREQPSVLAERIAGVHNRFRLAITEGGVLVFSPAGYSVEPFKEKPPGLAIEQLPFPVVDRQVTPAAVQRWLKKYRAWQGEAYETRERLREEARARHAVRVGVAAMNRGNRAGAFPCFSCRKFKPEPAAVCEYCGDDPVTHNGDRHEFNRAWGYAA